MYLTCHVRTLLTGTRSTALYLSPDRLGSQFALVYTRQQSLSYLAPNLAPKLSGASPHFGPVFHPRRETRHEVRSSDRISVGDLCHVPHFCCWRSSRRFSGRT